MESPSGPRLGKLSSSALPRSRIPKHGLPQEHVRTTVGPDNNNKHSEKSPSYICSINIHRLLVRWDVLILRYGLTMAWFHYTFQGVIWYIVHCSCLEYFLCILRDDWNCLLAHFCHYTTPLARLFYFLASCCFSRIKSEHNISCSFLNGYI